MSTTQHDHSILAVFHEGLSVLSIPEDFHVEDPFLEMDRGHTSAEFLKALEVVDAYGLMLVETDDAMPELIGADRIRWFVEPKE